MVNVLASSVPLAAGGAGATVGIGVVGALALVAALAWRASTSMGVRRRIRVALSDQDPGVRRRGVELAIERGLASTAEMLLGVARDEKDPTVLAALVHGIAQRQWEPASTPRIVELRLWAKAYVDAHEELRADYERPVGALVDRPARRSSDATPRALVNRSAPAKRRVLVTGAGGPAGIAVVRDLVRHGHYAVAVDADPLAAGLRLADEGHVVPRFDDPSYGEAIGRIARDARVDALICTVAEEYGALDRVGDALHAAGVHTLFPSPESVRACIDKWEFAEFCARESLPVPATALGNADGIDAAPWIVKPRFGRGSRDVHVVRSKRELAVALKATPEPIVQTLLHGEEFTADALVGPTGEVVAVVPRWRLETKAGISTKGRTFSDDGVEEAVRRTLEALARIGFVGPANVQGFVTEDGSVRLHEVNPRFSGALPLSIHAGAELVETYLSLVMGESLGQQRLTFRPDVVMVRHFDEVFEG